MNKIFRIFVVGAPPVSKLIKEHFHQEFEFDSTLILIDSKYTFLQEFNAKTPDLVIVDSTEINLTDNFILSFTKAKDQYLPVILLKSNVDKNKYIKIMAGGASDVIEKQDLASLLKATHREIIAYQSLKKRIGQREQAYHLARIGSWEIDLTDGTTYWSDQVREIAEVSKHFEPTLEETINFFSDDGHREQVNILLNRLIESGGDFQFESMIERPKEVKKWVRVVGDSMVVDGETVKIFGTAQDITQRKEIESRLSQVNNRLTNVIEQSNNIYYEHDINGDMTYISSQFKDFFGLSSDKKNLNWKDLTSDHPKNLEALKVTEKAYKTGKSQPPYEMQLKRGNGETLWVLVNETPIVKDDKTIRIAGTLTDVTEIKKAQIEVEKLSLVAQNTQNLVVITDKEGKTEWVNEAFINKTGYDFQEVIGKKPGDLLQGPDTDPKTVSKVSRLLKKEKPFSVTILNYTKAGEKYWLKMDIAPVFDKEGKLKNFFSIQEDITQKRKLQNDLQEINERLKLLIEASPIAIFQTDAQGVIVDSWNKAAERIFSFNQKEAIGKRFYDIADISKRDLSSIKRIQKGEILQQEAIKILDKDHKQRILEVSTGPVFDQNQKLQRTLVLVTDITELHEQHQMMKKSNEEKTILLQEIHHRVKNNLAIVSGLLELQLMNGEDNMTIRKSIYRIKAIANVHEQLYNSNNLSEINLADYYKNLLDPLITNLGTDRNITYNLNFDIETLNINQAIPLGILTTELVTNSIKYAFNGHPSGNINLVLSRTPDGKLYFKYNDIGVGFDFDDKLNSGSFGIVLIQTLLNQLTDDYNTYNNQGFNLEFTFHESERGAHSNISYAEQHQYEENLRP